MKKESILFLIILLKTMKSIKSLSVPLPNIKEISPLQEKITDLIKDHINDNLQDQKNNIPITNPIPKPLPISKEIYNIDILNNLKPNENCLKRGLTWGTSRNCLYCKFGISLVSCRGNPTVNNNYYCDRYKGDTQCKERRPLLCIKKLKISRPKYLVNSKEPFPMTYPGNVESFNSWTGGFIRKTKPVMGCQIKNKKHADKICEYYFGCDWKMARENDGRYKIGMGGNIYSDNFWNFPLGVSSEQYFGYGNIGHHNHNNGSVHIDSSPHNNWNRFWIYPRHFFFKDGVCWNGYQDGFNWPVDYYKKKYENDSHFNSVEKSRNGFIEDMNDVLTNPGHPAFAPVN